MTYITLSEFEDIEADVDCNSSYFNWSIDLGQAGETEIQVEASDVIEQLECFTSVSEASVDLDHIISRVIDEGEIIALLMALLGTFDTDSLMDLIINAEEEAA